MPNGLNHRQDGGNLGNSENGCSEDLDPLDELFQLDNIMCTALEKEALVLLTQLFQNIMVLPMLSKKFIIPKVAFLLFIEDYTPIMLKVSHNGPSIFILLII